MKVILLEDVEKLGKKYDLKEVKDGYARNFLIPKKLVKPATKEALRWLEAQKELLAKDHDDTFKKAQEAASKLDGMEVTIEAKIGDQGQLFEKITAQKIADHLKSLGFDVKKAQIQLENPIMELGEFPVKVALDHNLEAGIKIIISQEEKT